MVKKSLDELMVGNSLNQCKDLNVETISKILTEQILKLDETLCDRLRNSRDIAGTTALIALRIVQTNELVVANIGDSRGVLCDSKGNAIGKRFETNRLIDDLVLILTDLFCILFPYFRFTSLVVRSQAESSSRVPADL